MVRVTCFDKKLVECRKQALSEIVKFIRARIVSRITKRDRREGWINPPANSDGQSQNVTNLVRVELRFERMFCILPPQANLCERNATLVSHPLTR